MEDASQILIQVLDLKHPLIFEQPLKQQAKRKRDANPSCQSKELGCYNGMLMPNFDYM